MTDTTTNAAPVKFTLQRVRLNSGGYDSGGSYWGVDAPLYWATDETESFYFRAADRQAAKTHIRTKHPTAMFYR